MNIDISSLIVHIEKNHESLIAVFSALLTPAIAILTGLIAYLQWQTNERKRKQDLFDMRYDNLYYPIFVCSENITKIREVELSFEEKGKRIENEIQNFWKQYSKYKFLISNEDSGKLQEHYNYMLEIIKKYDFTNIKTEDNAEEILSILALLYHAMQMEEILAKYLRLEPDSIIYKTKCVLSKLKNKIFPHKHNRDTLKVENNKSNNEV